MITNHNELQVVDLFRAKLSLLISRHVAVTVNFLFFFFPAFLPFVISRGPLLKRKKTFSAMKG